MQVKIKKLVENAVVPSYAKEGDAGMDLTAISRLIEKQYIEYDTGISVEIPDGFMGLLFPRSSITNTGLMLKNGVGVLDSGYRNSIKFRFKATSSPIYEVGDRVGQLVILPYPKIELIESEELSKTSRGIGGYGSTGK